MAPKPSGKAAKGPPIPTEPDPAASLPPDLPTECPFEYSWRAAVCLVQAAEGINIPAIKEAFKQLQVLQQLAISDLAVRLDPADPLAAEISAAETASTAPNANGGLDSGSMPPALAGKLMQHRFNRDQGLSWKIELVRRRETLARAAADAKAAADASEAAAQSEADARDKLSSVKASLPQPQLVSQPPRDPAESEPINPDGADANGQQTEPQEPQYVQPELSRTQKRLLADSEAELAAAVSRVATLAQAAAAAEKALGDVQQAMHRAYCHYEAYWVEGLPSTASGIAAAVAAGIPVRAVVWLHHPQQATAASEQGVASSRCSWPEELVKLQTSIAAAPWDSALAGLALLPVPVNDCDSPFTTVPQAGTIANPPWAAASSAAAALKAAMAAAAAAADPKPPALAGSKAAQGARVNSSTPTSAKPATTAASNTSMGGAAAAANTAATGPEEVAGCKELARVLLTVRDQARVYDHWRASVRVYLMPKPQEGGCIRSCYERLLSTVPPERQNVPVVLHAVLEQVCHNCMEDASMLDETQQEVQQVLAMSEAEQALTEAFSQLMTEDKKLLDAPAVSSGGLTVLYEGDELGAASCGLTTGYVHGKAALSDHSTAASVLAGPGSASSRREAAAPLMSDVTKGLSEADVDAVEQHMLQLLQFPGLSSAAEKEQGCLQVNDEAQRKRTLQHALLQAHSDGLPVATLERYQLLHAATAMLPAGVRSAHAEGLQQRHYQEHLEPHVLRQVLLNASMSYPSMATRHWEGTGEELLIFFADEDTDRHCTRNMPHIKTFQQYWEQMLAQNCALPELCPQVYELTADVSTQHWQQLLLYNDTGAIASRGSEGQLAYHHNGNTVRLLPHGTDSTYELVANLKGGAVVSACCTHPQQPSMAVTGPLVSATAVEEPAPIVLAEAEPPVTAKKGTSHAARKSSTGTRPDSATEKASRKPASTDTTAAAAAGSNAVPQAQPVGAGAAGSCSQVGVAAAASTALQEACSMGPITAASATASAVRVCTPQGLMIEVNTDGRVLMAPVAAPQVKEFHSTGVDVLGAPVAAGQLSAGLVDGPFAWHALLPDGTLIKAGAVSEGRAQAAAASDGQLLIMHPDGRISKQQQGAIEVAECSSIPTAGWLHTDLEGKVTWAIDADALEDLKTAAANTAANAAAAAEAAAAAAAAEAAAAEVAAAGKKGGGKGSDKRPLDKQKSVSPAAPAPGSDAAAGGAGGNAVGGGGTAADPCGLHELLAKLESIEPQEKGSIRTAILTDPDTQATVVTREDHLMAIKYVDGSTLLQDAEGCRVSFVNGGWTFEASSMPVVQGDELGIAVTISPGTTLQWNALTKCVTLHHASSDATLVATPCGRMAFSSQQPMENLDLFADLAPPQHQEQQEDAPATAGSSNADKSGAPGAVGGSEAVEADPAETAAAHTTEPSAAVLPLQDVCSVQECWGMLAVDLCTGEAVIHEEGGCRLHLGPGMNLKVWRNDHLAAQPVADEQQAPGPEVGVSDATAIPVDGSRQSTSSRPASTAQPGVAVAGEACASPPSPTTAGSNHLSTGAKQDSNEMFDDELDEERAARLAAEAASAAAAAAAAAAEAAAGAEAAAAEAAAAQLPPPVAAGVKPGLFVIDCRSGAGYEVLDDEVVSKYMKHQTMLQGCKHKQQAVLGASEPGTQSHSFLTTYCAKGAALEPLELAEPAAAVAVQLDAARHLLSLKRTDVFVPADPVQRGKHGLKLPRISALNPGYAIAGAAATCSTSKGSLIATRDPGTAQASSNSLEQVVVVRELLELPRLDADGQANAQRVLDVFAQWQQGQDAVLASRSPPEDPRSDQLQQESAEVAAMLSAAGFHATPSSGHLHVVHDQIMAEQAAAERSEQRQLAEAQARAAAEAAAKRKPYKPWVRKVGPYDHCPQKPEPGRTLKYFAAEEGLTAAAADPLLQGAKITRNDLPPAKPVQPASAGMQQKRGVYLSSSTTLATDDTHGYAAGSAALGSPSGTQAPGDLRSAVKSPHSRRDPGQAQVTAKVGALHASPLMYAGKPASLGGPVMDAIAAATAAAAAHLKQQQLGVAQDQAAAAVRMILEDAGGLSSSSARAEPEQLAGHLGSSSPGLGVSMKSHTFDVYGQPRLRQPPLPASHLKSQVAADLNVEYLAREAASMRTTKTSSASLIKCSGKAGKQLALSPGHIHFGNVTVGVPAHRTARLLNCSTDVVRFSVVQPELPLRVLHRPAPLPAGMEAVLTVELVAEHSGNYVGEVTVKSEVNVLTLTVSAKVLPAPAAVQAVSARNDAADGEEGVGAVSEGADAIGASASLASPGSAAEGASLKK